MIKLLKFMTHALLAALFTLFTQIGGIVYLLLLPVASRITSHIKPLWKKRLTAFAVHSLGYLMVIWLVLPPIARYFEPYLKVRWGANFGKMGFHGCQAVRHDDHLHVSI